MFDHVSLGVTDLARSAAFYDAVLGALGYERLPCESARAALYGPPGHLGEAPFAVIAQREGPVHGRGTHLAFLGRSREAINGFHAQALVHGGTCDGPPGIRDHYAPGYYAAFVVDPDGHRIEAVLHEG